MAARRGASETFGAGIYAGEGCGDCGGGRAHEEHPAPLGSVRPRRGVSDNAREQRMGQPRGEVGVDVDQPGDDRRIVLRKPGLRTKSAQVRHGRRGSVAGSGATAAMAPPRRPGTLEPARQLGAYPDVVYQERGSRRHRHYGADRGVDIGGIARARECGRCAAVFRTSDGRSERGAVEISDDQRPPLRC